MFPIILDIEKSSVMLVGNGKATLRRLELLNYNAAGKVRVFADGAIPELKSLAGNRLVENLPAEKDFDGFDVVMVADFDEEKSAEIYHAAKRKGRLVNVEDKVKYCDYHVPAIVRRGDLLVTVSTNNSSPRLARKLRQLFENMFTDKWAERLKLIKEKRLFWKKAGAGIEEVASKTDEILNNEGWLKEICPCNYKN